MFLASSPASVRAARRIFDEQLRTWGLADDRAAAQSGRLVVSELVGNAIRYSASEVQLSIVGHYHSVEISVGDDSPEVPILNGASGLEESGRGLRIVAAVSDEWGTRTNRHGGKDVWARLVIDAPTGSPVSEGCRLRM